MIQRNLTRLTNFVINHDVVDNGWYFSLLTLFVVGYITATVALISYAFVFNVALGIALSAFHVYHMARWFYRQGRVRAAELKREKPKTYGYYR